MDEGKAFILVDPMYSFQGILEKKHIDLWHEIILVAYCKKHIDLWYEIVLLVHCIVKPCITKGDIITSQQHPVRYVQKAKEAYG